MRLTTCVIAGLYSFKPVTAGVFSEQIPNVPSGWIRIGTPSAEEQITLTIALKHQNEAQFYAKVDSVSNPSSTEYGQWLEKEDVDAILKPSTGSKTAVLSWLSEAGVKDIKSDDYLVQFNANIKTANKLLNAAYQEYEHDGVTAVRTLSVSIDHAVAHHIALIEPTTDFSIMSRDRLPDQSVVYETSSPKARERMLPPSCSTVLSPSCLVEMYNITGYNADEKSGSRVGFVSFLPEHALYADLAKFEENNNLPARNLTTTLIKGARDIQGKYTSLRVSPEGNLDSQSIVGITSGKLPVDQYLFPPDIMQHHGRLIHVTSVIPYFHYLLNQPNSRLPQVISHSYGQREDGISAAYASYACNQIAQLGARGISYLVASGDHGVGAGCKDIHKKVRFNVYFPASCPYVTSNASSGGFSDYFPRPSYQDQAVNDYIKKVPASVKAYYDSYTNFAGRGFPDVAVHSEYPYYGIVHGGRDLKTGGTSASAPVLAGIIGLLNDARLRAGKKSLGFLNPWLYSVQGNGWTDVNGGAAVGCNGHDPQYNRPIPDGAIVPGAAWNATGSWDPVTGFGIPNFVVLKELALALK